MSINGQAVKLDALTGAITDGAGMRDLWGADIASALVGSVTIAGANDATGAPAAWVIESGTSGHVAPPSPGASGGGLMSYTLSSASDIGKCIVMFRPR